MTAKTVRCNWLECDGCGVRFDRSFGVAQLRILARENGWQSRRGQFEREDYCPECSMEFRR